MSKLKSSLDKFTTRSLRYGWTRFNVDHRRHRPMEIVFERAAEQSADFIMANMTRAVLFDERDDFWKFVMGELPKEGFLMECGVFQGASINFIADELDKRGDARVTHGFDSFEGLEEHWFGENLPAGYFDQKGKLPSVRANVQLYKGWVQDTVAPFLADRPEEKLGLLHIDTDTYTPAKFLLDIIKPRLTSGSVIVFDELIGYPNWQEHEYKALAECYDADTYEFIGFTSRQAAIRIR